jgi:Rrf2 family transcriptional regulator, nitric oxide-sensitive transcriptional repressor
MSFGRQPRGDRKRNIVNIEVRNSAGLRIEAPNRVVSPRPQEYQPTMISSTAEYALRAMVYLATHREKAETAQVIAENTKVPAGYMSKVLQDLARAEIVNSQRGPHGGFTLARSADDITILDVMNAVDPIKRIRTCPLALPEHGTRLCSLHQRLDDAIAHIEDVFAHSRISDMLKPSRSGSRCVFPTVKGGPVATPAKRGRRPSPGRARIRKS